jgi:uncharacterized protein (DUF4415 family)
MKGKSGVTGKNWVDPDDAPELTGEELDRPDGKWCVGEREVSPAEGKVAFRELLRKKRISIWLDESIIEHFKAKAKGKGYQTVINETLKTAIEQENLEKLLRKIIREEMHGNRTENRN